MEPRARWKSHGGQVARQGLTGAFVGYWGCMHSDQKVQARCGDCTPARAATLMQGKRAGEKYIGCSIAPLRDRPEGQWQRKRLAWGRVGQWLAGTGAGTGGGRALSRAGRAAGGGGGGGSSSVAGGRGRSALARGR